MEDIKYKVKYDMSEAVEEAFKVLRANIHFCDPENKLKTIAITSYNPGDGKSTTSLNLSITMAKSGMKVLFVDADLRKPMLFKPLVSKDFKGLSNYLLDQAGLNEIVNKTDVDGLYFISCGIKTQNPGELISTQKFRDFLCEAQYNYDIIIIDTPPIGSVIDGAIIASQTDAVIIVISQNAVKTRNAIMMKEQLEKANANILGVVLNKVNKLDYKNYYGGYDYYDSKRKYSRKSLKELEKVKRDKYD
ncbi:MAG: CpsD/CapB family tyrosine-protein kinase [Bacillota bacterium]|nr:CpsD/CapB family tyrosine-protein kinase [Bacillota bacterium]